VRVLGISTTNMDVGNPRYSTSDALLETAIAHAGASGSETRLIRLRELSFRACEGYYSKSARACTWPCSITQMDPADQLDRVYEAIVFWADVVLVATPIRWGVASSLYFKMAERLNCVQNQITLRNRVMLRNKVASFIITGGQDNVQGVAGQALCFFAELGCQFPQFRTSRTRAAGRPRTWKRTSPTCNTARSCTRARARSSIARSISRAG
jgi:multimeric flavodoxin WrbA